MITIKELDKFKEFIGVLHPLKKEKSNRGILYIKIQRRSPRSFL